MIETLTTALSRTSTGDWLLLAAGFLLVFYIAGTWNYDYFQRRGIPSTKPRFPFFGDFVAVMTGFRAFTDAIQDFYDKGKGHGVFGVFEITRPILWIRDPELLKVVGVKEFDNFMNHRSFASEKTDPIFGKNLFNLKDQTWRDMRATLSPAFTTSKIKAMLPLMSQCADQFSQYLREKYVSSKEGSMTKPLVFDLKDLFTRLTNDIIATTAFGVSCDSLKNPNNEFYTRGKTLTTFSKFRSFVLFAFLAIPKLMEKRGIIRPDVLQLLMQARQGQLKAEKEDSAEAENLGVSGKILSDDDISAQAIIFFFGGFETVATALCFTTVVLSHHPEIQKKLRVEIDEVMKTTGGTPTYEAIQGMKYLDAVISEVLRLYPPAPSTDRICQNDVVLPAGENSNAITIPKGTIVQAPIVGFHTDPQYWDEPLKFDPERFSDENKHKIKPFTYMPFGMGPRICIGFIDLFLRHFSSGYCNTNKQSSGPFLLRDRVLEPSAVSFVSTLVTDDMRERQQKKIVRPDLLQLLQQAREGAAAGGRPRSAREREEIDAAKGSQCASLATNRCCGKKDTAGQGNQFSSTKKD
ncbi:AGAP012296-PA-like protein [Gryllus bimaculatus]|nr:AGAP012296-PA-like protein [Gryllus bimaculatus]